MPPTDTAIRNAKPAEKPVRLFDERGLYLEVSTTGGKWWRLKYRFAGKEKRLSLGIYPDVSLKDARDRRDAERRLLAEGIDPSVNRKVQKSVRAGRAASGPGKLTCTDCGTELNLEQSSRIPPCPKCHRTEFRKSH